MKKLKKIPLILISCSFISFFAECQHTSSSSSPSPSPSPLPYSYISYSPAQSPSPSPSSPDPASPSTSSSSDLPAPSPKNEVSERPSVLPLLFPDSVRKPMHNPVLMKVCDTTDYPQECLTSISPFLTGESDPVSILKMEMQALRTGFQKSVAKARELSRDQDTPSSTKSSLELCVEMYDSGITDLDDAINAIAAYDIAKLNTVLSATIADIESCEEAFMEESDVDSPMKEHDNELSKIASNNLAIATLIR